MIKRSITNFPLHFHLSVHTISLFYDHEWLLNISVFSKFYFLMHHVFYFIILLNVSLLIVNTAYFLQFNVTKNWASYLYLHLFWNKGKVHASFLYFMEKYSHAYAHAFVQINMNNLFHCFLLLAHNSWTMNTGIY